MDNQIPNQPPGTAGSDETQPVAEDLGSEQVAKNADAIDSLVASIWSIALRTARTLGILLLQPHRAGRLLVQDRQRPHPRYVSSTVMMTIAALLGGAGGASAQSSTNEMFRGVLALAESAMTQEMTELLPPVVGAALALATFAWGLSRILTQAGPDRGHAFHVALHALSAGILALLASNAVLNGLVPRFLHTWWDGPIPDTFRVVGGWSLFAIFAAALPAAILWGYLRDVPTRRAYFLPLVAIAPAFAVPLVVLTAATCYWPRVVSGYVPEPSDPEALTMILRSERTEFLYLDKCSVLEVKAEGRKLTLPMNTGSQGTLCAERERLNLPPPAADDRFLTLSEEEHTTTLAFPATAGAVCGSVELRLIGRALGSRREYPIRLYLGAFEFAPCGDTTPLPTPSPPPSPAPNAGSTPSVPNVAKPTMGDTNALAVPVRGETTGPAGAVAPPTGLGADHGRAEPGRRKQTSGLPFHRAEALEVEATVHEMVEGIAPDEKEPEAGPPPGEATGVTAGKAQHGAGTNPKAVRSAGRRKRTAGLPFGRGEAGHGAQGVPSKPVRVVGPRPTPSADDDSDRADAPKQDSDEDQGKRDGKRK